MWQVPTNVPNRVPNVPNVPNCVPIVPNHAPNVPNHVPSVANVASVPNCTPNVPNGPRRLRGILGTQGGHCALVTSSEPPYHLLLDQGHIYDL